jgi:hypothetical protein
MDEHTGVIEQSRERLRLRGGTATGRTHLEDPSVGATRTEGAREAAGSCVSRRADIGLGVV